MWKKVLNLLAFVVLFFGGINWMLIGIFNLNLISTVFMGYRSVGSVVTYILMGVSAIWLVLSSIVSNGKIQFVQERYRR